MLDFHLSSTIAESRWGATPKQAALPMHPAEYFGRSDTCPELPDSRRQFRRIRCHGRAVALCGNKLYGVYLIDVSPKGIGFYSPEQMFPLDRVRLSCDQYDSIEMEIRRCLRTQADCYACGAKFVAGPMSPTTYREFIARLRS